MLKLALLFLTSKGTLIGLIAGFLKVMQDIREGRFKWVIATTDITASSIVGYSIYSWASESQTLASWQIIGLTVMFSLNAFLVIKIITEPDLIKQLLRGWFKLDK